MFTVRPPQDKQPARLFPRLALGLLALLSGCGAGLFLHISPVEEDSHLRLFLGGGGNSVVVLHGKEAFVSDVKFAQMARRLRFDVEEELGRKVQRILLTHAHADHASGLKLYPNVGAVLVHPKTRERLEKDGVKAPWVEVEREVRLVLGDDVVDVRSYGGGHTDGDLVGFFPKRKLLVAGDLISRGYEPSADLKYGGSLLELRRTWDKILDDVPFERAVPGHGGVMSRAEVERQVEYLRALEAAVRSAVQKGVTADEAARTVVLKDFVLEPIPFRATRESNVRAMFAEVAAAEGR